MNRDLTFNAPPSDSERLRNPFEDTGSVSNSSEAESFNDRANLQAPSFKISPSGSNSPSPFDHHQYSSASNERLLGEKNSFDETQPHNDIGASAFLPNVYDRYPAQSSSRVMSCASSSHLGAKFPENWPKSPMPDEDHDFGPFGGYPATSFPLYIQDKEDDDYIHNPDPVADAEYDKNRFMHDLRNMDRKSFGGLISFVALVVAALLVFVLLPALTYTGLTDHYEPKSYEVLTAYQYPLLSAIRTNLVDPDTPQDALTRKTRNGEVWDLVFSDEFNAAGRTFYEGDDQFFQGPDIHYDATKDLEWYDPDAASTANGTLNLRMDAFKNHGLFYRSGMIQSWNKMCFTEGMLEISARLPNYGNISGLWPGLWTMGNLGRPGFMGTTEGVWPYTYDSCDAGITPNQSSPDGISYLPGQRLNSCTCKGESHPNPGRGRGAPEIDILEGEVSDENGRVSQSFQVAPYDIWYIPDYEFVEIYNASVTTINTYAGGPFQQAVSGVTSLNTTWYERGDNAGHFQTYGYEYLNHDTDGYLTWYVGNNPTMTIYANALHPNGNIGWRKISKEPMSLIMNLGISNNWAYIDWASLVFPATMRVDYVRLYQPPGKTQLGCDPPDYPTYDYIQAHKNIYSNFNLTSYAAGGYTFPKNSLMHGCST